MIFSQVGADRTSAPYVLCAMDLNCPWTPLSPSSIDQSVVQKGLWLAQVSPDGTNQLANASYRRW